MRYVAVFVVSFLFLPLFAPVANGQVLLNEIMADPAHDWDGDGALGAKADEWVEVINAGSVAVDLAAYRLTDTSAGTSWRFALSGQLAAGAVRVFYGSEVVAWQSVNGVGAYGLSLNNTGDSVSLYRVGPGDTSQVDQVTYGGTEVKDDRSIGRLPDGAGAWVVFDGLNPLSSSPPDPTGCFPSPGALSSCPTPVKNQTWGALKSRYR